MTRILIMTAIGLVDMLSAFSYGSQGGWDYSRIYTYIPQFFSDFFLDLYKDTRLGVHFRLASSDIFLLHNTTTRWFGYKAISIVYYYLCYINTCISAFSKTDLQCAEDRPDLSRQVA